MTVKRIKMFLLLGFILLLFTGCGEKVGNSYSAEDLQVGKISGTEGIFILHKDGTFSSTVKNFKGYAGSSEDSTQDRFLWYCETEDLLEMLPVLSAGDKLVLLYNSQWAIPKNLTIEKYEDRGYTTGAHFYIDGEALYFSTTDSLRDSAVEDVIIALEDEQKYKVTTINGSENLPKGNIDANMQLLLGMEKGKYYEFGILKGTKYKRFTVAADTRVLQSSKMVIFADDFYRVTKDGYFEVNMPSDLEAGYYYINGEGMIFIE